ncbi:MAG: hypothetical protein ACQKBY_03080 [Verrucomicrobiales bacterium]
MKAIAHITLVSLTCTVAHAATVLQTTLISDGSGGLSQGNPFFDPTTSLGGNQSAGLWDGVSNQDHSSGYGNYPGFTSWSNPMAANSSTGSFTAALNYGSAGAGGGPYAAGQRIYAGGMSLIPNTDGGQLLLSDATPLADLQTLVFQIQIGGAFGYDFHNNTLPTLTINGTGASLAADFSSIIDHASGTYTLEGDDLDIEARTYTMQWDLSGITEPITSFELAIDIVQHAQIYGLQLNQSDASHASSILPAAIPEPSLAILSLCALPALVRRNRQTRQR